LRGTAGEVGERFVGAERGLKRLGLITVGDLRWSGGLGAVDAPLGADGGIPPTVGLSATLRQALDALVTARADRALVVDLDGDREPVGVLTMDRISRELAS